MNGLIPRDLDICTLNCSLIIIRREKLIKKDFHLLEHKIFFNTEQIDEVRNSSFFNTVKKEGFGILIKIVLIIYVIGTLSTLVTRSQTTVARLHSG